MKIMVCKSCNKGFEATGQNQKFCEPGCQKLFSKEQTKRWTATYRTKKPEKQMLKSAKHRASLKGVPFDLDDSDVVIPDLCPVLGIPLKTHVNGGAGGKQDSYSLDRIVPEKGYVKGNVQVISNLANTMKGAATPEQLKLFAEWIMKTYG